MSVDYSQPKYGWEGGLLMPKRWDYDGDLQRREPVLDADNGKRVIRYVGFRRCMCCKSVMWTEDVSRVRMCEHCKKYGPD